MPTSINRSHSHVVVFPITFPSLFKSNSPGGIVREEKYLDPMYSYTGSFRMPVYSRYFLWRTVNCFAVSQLAAQQAHFVMLRR